MSTSIPLLELKGVTRKFGSHTVLRGIDLSIYPGQVTAILGDNGAGKSTLIKLMTGYHQPTSGQLLWQGSPVLFHKGSGPQQARKLGIEVVYQDLGLVDTLSVARNFFLGRERTRRFFRIPFLAGKSMSDEAIKRLKDMGARGITDGNSSISRLSGGQRQAIAICRARYFGAKLLILDEPTSALSLRQTEQVLSYVREAAKEGLAVIFITHTLNHLEDLADQFVVLYQGKKAGDFSSGQISPKALSSLITRGFMEPGLQAGLN
jgi:simple sugar transport system ATP-binding protein